jgi:hypothetical protein
MELMKGKVWFERPVDGGAIFAIELLKVDQSSPSQTIPAVS